MSGFKRNVNLNTLDNERYMKPHDSGRRNQMIRKRKAHEDFHYRGKIKFVGSASDIRECKECHKILPTTAYTSHALRGDGAYYLLKICRECRTQTAWEARHARKKATPKPTHCDCCNEKIKELQVDHIHGSPVFRGWLCNICNSGIGKLGDDLEGVLQGAIFLENDTDKIIETLHKVSSEMFARTK